MQQLSQTCLRRRFTQVATALTLLATLNGCAVVATGAAALGVSSVTDPRTIGSQLDDQTIEMKANAKLGNDEQLGEYRLRVVSYDQNVLLIGQVPNEAARQRAERIISDTNGIDNIFNQVRISSQAGLSTQTNDAWITSQVKLKLAANDKVDASDVKVVTENGEVFLLGIVGGDSANIAVDIARNVKGVTRVIKAFKAPR
ncbi:division/outer membrane stress-associated lipid-binding lipoprotein [Idiomarina aquatica]|jgi:osmotically-inducible protein OsmY|uniref:Osmotically-inducible protein OsmY n=1 Tax=Idiomarina aquatica TaxID=1327752 RepID=A0AA94EGH4_9GAMM|nr:division/outer membrane stress-associated lipid-binding lipoprotein [Idiomarina aquatica]RUO45355.1 osmotically-inducible protein OsmY [Idiomarina aquatica]